MLFCQILSYFHVMNRLKHIKEEYIIRSLLTLFFYTITTNAVANNHLWTLKECTDYALSHSLDIKVQQNACKENQIQLDTYKKSRLPNLSSKVYQNFNFGRSLNASNSYINTNTSQTSFSIGSEIPLFTGFRISNEISMRKLFIKVGLLDLEKVKNDIRLKVADAYFQVLYDREMRNAAQMQVEIDSAQVERMEKLLINGKASYVDCSQQKATLANSQLTLNQNQNHLNLSLLALTQVMNLTQPDSFDIYYPDNISTDNIILQNPQNIYMKALMLRPEIKSKQYRIDIAEKNIEVTKSSKYPQASLVLGMGSNFYRTSGYSNESFIRQLKNNFSQQIQLEITIPLFNRYSTRNEIKKACIEKSNSELALLTERQNLYKAIQQAYYDALNARSKYNSCIVALQSSKDAFKLMKAKYEYGKANITEFDASKNKYLAAETNLVQSKFEYLYKSQILNFYCGEDIVIN